MSEEYETTLLIVNTVYVYRIPPRQSSTGYKAGDWPDSDLIWTGKLTVIEKGSLAVIRLISRENGSTFAECPVQQGSVEPVLDSSRYFVLRVEDPSSHRHAFLGMGFQERSEAFDFNASLQDHDRRVKDEQELARRREEEKTRPAVDYSLHSGQTIHVELKAKPATGTGTPAKPAASTASGVKFTESGALLPPPSAGRTRRGPQQPHQQVKNDAWGDFTAAPQNGGSQNTTSFF